MVDRDLRLRAGGLAMEHDPARHRQFRRRRLLHFEWNASSTDPIGCGGVLLNPGGSQTAAAPNPSQCGIKIDNSTCTSTSLDYCAGGNGVMGGGTNIVWK